MNSMAMSEEDRTELERLCAEVDRYAAAVENRDRFMTKLYDSYRADPGELSEVTGLRARSQIYTAFHRYQSQRVRLRTHRPKARDRKSGGES